MKTNYESLDYEFIESKISKKKTNALTTKYFTKMNISRWVMVYLIGTLTGVVAFLINEGVHYIDEYKFYLTDLADDWCHDCVWLPMMIYILFNLLMAGIAAALVSFVEPVAGGSGIPEIKSYLNGVKIPRILRLKTLFAKALGVMFSVGAGLAVGKEGPMIHSGSIIAGGITQGKSTTLKRDLNILQEFRNDQEKRDFVSGGAAAGVSAAFGAPIGGVLFSLEEGSSFWNQQLTWRTLFCSMISTFTLNFLLSGVNFKHWGNFTNPGLVNFGTFAFDNYSILHFPVILVIAVLGGILGALFNYLNIEITKWRNKVLVRPIFRFLETLLVSLVTSVLSFIISFFFHNCLRAKENLDTFQFYCPDGFYNDMATIFYTPHEIAIRQLLHDGYDSFSIPTLGFFFVIYFFLSCWTYGTAVPSGLFIPTILLGSSMGRLVGTIASKLIPNFENQQGIFALIGAAAMLGGIMRMTLSLCVIIVEATRDITYGLPIMLTLIISKWVGDNINDGIYDEHISLRGIPFLHWEGPVIMRKFESVDVMNYPVVTVKSLEKVVHIYNILKETKYNGFPVVNSENKVIGLILRSQLITLLRKKPFTTSKRHSKSFYHLVSIDDFLEDYPRFPPLETVSLTSQDLSKYMDVTPYMATSPFKVNTHTSLQKVFMIFRTMGLRHIIVVDNDNVAQGMLTRHDLEIERILDQRLKRTNLVSSTSSDISYIDSEETIDHSYDSI